MKLNTRQKTSLENTKHKRRITYVRVYQPPKLTYCRYEQYMGTANTEGLKNVQMPNIHVTNAHGHMT